MLSTDATKIPLSAFCSPRTDIPGTFYYYPPFYSLLSQSNSQNPHFSPQPVTFFSTTLRHRTSPSSFYPNPQFLPSASPTTTTTRRFQQTGSVTKGGYLIITCIQRHDYPMHPSRRLSRPTMHLVFVSPHSDPGPTLGNWLGTQTSFHLLLSCLTSSSTCLANMVLY